MRINATKLEGSALDWAVGQTMPEYMEGFSVHKELGLVGPYWAPSFSTRWEIGGPLIDKHIVYMDSHHEGEEKYAVSREPIRYRIGGPTYLVAAMRSIVRAKIGEEVDVPEELL